MTTPSPSTGLWQYLLTLAETLDRAPASLEDLHGHLLALEEGFAGTFDPADEFPEFAVVALCRALRRQVEQQRHTQRRG